jgi:hypothetical protein
VKLLSNNKGAALAITLVLMTALMGLVMALDISITRTKTASSVFEQKTLVRIQLEDLLKIVLEDIRAGDVRLEDGFEWAVKEALPLGEVQLDPVRIHKFLKENQWIVRMSGKCVRGTQTIQVVHEMRIAAQEGAFRVLDIEEL